MMKILKSICALAALALGGCVCLVFVGCLSVAEIERLPDAALPIQEVRPVNGVDHPHLQAASGMAWTLNRRRMRTSSVLWAAAMRGVTPPCPLSAMPTPV